MLIRKSSKSWFKTKNPQADTSPLEEEIDELVYQLYGLSEEEKNIVEGGLNP
jgi:hypothetical protein